MIDKFYQNVFLTSMLCQGLRAYESQGSLNGGLCPRDVGKTKLWHEEGQFSGCHLVGVTGMDCIHLAVCSMLSTDTVDHNSQVTWLSHDYSNIGATRPNTGDLIKT